MTLSSSYVALLAASYFIAFENFHVTNFDVARIDSLILTRTNIVIAHFDFHPHSIVNLHSVFQPALSHSPVPLYFSRTQLTQIHSDNNQYQYQYAVKTELNNSTETRESSMDSTPNIVTGIAFNGSEVCLLYWNQFLFRLIYCIHIGGLRSFIRIMGNANWINRRYRHWSSTSYSTTNSSPIQHDRYHSNGQNLFLRSLHGWWNTRLYSCNWVYYTSTVLIPLYNVLY